MLVFVQHNEYSYCRYCQVLCTLGIKLVRIPGTWHDLVKQQPQQKSSSTTYSSNSRQDARPTVGHAVGNTVIAGYY